MPSPFVTNCSHYEMKYGSRPECFDSCIYRTLEKMNQFPVDLFWDEDLIKKNNFTQEFHYKRGFTSNMNRLKCQPDCAQEECVQEFFQVSKSHDYGARNTGKHLLMVHPPLSYELQVTYCARMRLEEYLIFIGSTLNFWIGFSMLNLFHIFIELLEYSKRKQARRTMEMRRRTMRNLGKTQNFLKNQSFQIPYQF